MAIPNQDSKKCTQCGEAKPLSEFYLQSAKRRSGRIHVACQPECKACNRLRTKLRYHSEKKAEIQAKDCKASKRRRAEMKALVFAAYGGYVCACCGETEQLFLSIDHINNDGAAFRRMIGGKRTAAGYPTYRWLVLNGFPSGFQVLCMNCNHGKRMNHGICPHTLLVRRNDQTKVVEASASKRDASIQSISATQSTASALILHLDSPPMFFTLDEEMV